MRLLGDILVILIKTMSEILAMLYFQEEDWQETTLVEAYFDYTPSIHSLSLTGKHE
jgi:hypothetical protein